MRTGHKLTAALAVLVISVLSLSVHDLFYVVFMVALPLTILWWFDLCRELRNSDSAAPFMRAVILFMGLPQAIFGLISIIIGISIIVWVIYNSFWPPNPHYSGGFLTFGAGPSLVLFGLWLLVDAFRRKPPQDKT
jgi:hypothetical protein